MFSYKFKICVHNSLQNNGTVLFVVKILAARVRRAFDSDMLPIYTSNTIWKIPVNTEVFRIFLKYFFCWRAYFLPVERSIWHRFSFIMDAMADLLIRIENEILKEISVERYLQ
jgi:hypothetical protein